MFLLCFFWLFYCDQICLSRCPSFVPLIFRWVSCHFQSCLIVFLFGCHAFSLGFLLLHIIFFLGSLFSLHASLLCVLGWVFFSEVWWFGVRFCLPFMIVIVLDEHFFFIITFTISIFLVLLCPFLMFLSVVSLFQVSFIERAGWSSVRRSTKELVSYLLAATEAFLFWCSVTVLAWCSSLSLFSSHCCFILIFCFFFQLFFAGCSLREVILFHH